MPTINVNIQLQVRYETDVLAGNIIPGNPTRYYLTIKSPVFTGQQATIEVSKDVYDAAATALEYDGQRYAYSRR